MQHVECSTTSKPMGGSGWHLLGHHGGEDHDCVAVPRRITRAVVWFVVVFQGKYQGSNKYLGLQGASCLGVSWLDYPIQLQLGISIVHDGLGMSRYPGLPRPSGCGSPARRWRATARFQLVWWREGAMETLRQGTVMVRSERSLKMSHLPFQHPESMKTINTQCFSILCDIDVHHIMEVQSE